MGITTNQYAYMLRNILKRNIFFDKKKISLKKWMEEKLTTDKELFEIQVS